MCEHFLLFKGFFLFRGIAMAENCQILHHFRTYLLSVAATN